MFVMWMDKRLSLVPGNIRSEQTISDSYTAEKSTGIQAVLSEKQNKTKQKNSSNSKNKSIINLTTAIIRIAECKMKS